MTQEQYRAALAELGWSQMGAARALGVNPRTSQRWAAGDLPVPMPIKILLMLARTFPGVAEFLIDQNA